LNREHRDRLRAKAQEWVRLGRRKDAGLLSEREVWEAEGWLDSPEGRLIDKKDDIWELVKISKWRQKRELRSSRRIGAAFAILSAALAVATLLMTHFWHAAQLQKQLAQLNYIDLQMLTLKFEAKRNAARISQLKRDADAASLDRVDVTEAAVHKEQDKSNEILGNIRTLAEHRSSIVKAILHESARLNNQLNEQQRKQLISHVSKNLHDASLTPESQLRIALYSVAAIPQNEDLNDELRTSIVKARLRSTFEPPGSNQVWAVAFNPVDPKQAAVGDDHGVVWLWNPMDDPEGKDSKELSVAGDIVNGLAFSPDGTKLAAVYRKSGAVVWNLATNKVLCSLGRRLASGLAISGANNYGGAVAKDTNNYGVAFAPDGRTLAVGGERSVQLWDLNAEGCPLKSDLKAHDDVFGVAFSRTRDLVAAASGDGKVTVWDLNQPDKQGREFTNSESSKQRAAMYAVEFSPTDSALMAASAADGRGYVWNIETNNDNAPTELLPRQTGTVGQIAFSPNGKWLVATATDKGQVIVADPRGRNNLDQLGGSKKPIFGVAFSPDSKFLLIGDLGGVASLWNIDADQDLSGDHDALIKHGAEQVDSLALTEKGECKILREMHIPIFELEVENFEKEAGFLCPLSFLGPLPDLPNVDMKDSVKKTVFEELTNEVLGAYDKFPLQTLLGIVICSIVVVYLLARLAMGAK
jgi:WD40 repeat protein